MQKTLSAQEKKFWKNASAGFGNSASNNVHNRSASIINFLKGKDGEKMIQNKDAVNIGREILKLLQK